MVRVVMGFMGGSVGNTNILGNRETSAKLLDLLAQHKVAEIDTARVYGSGASEKMLGELKAYKRFRVATKAPAFSPGSLKPENIRRNCDASLAALGQEQLDIYYLHGPDQQTPFRDQCSAMNDLYRQGKFRRFGISNLSSTQIQEVYDICKQNDYVLPTVYQGGYNPILRSSERHRLPLCHTLNIQFYAFSPLAGGFLAKPLDSILNPEKGSRYEAMSVFGQIYCIPPFIAAVEKLQQILTSHGPEMTILDATLRWSMHHSPLCDSDAVILGASSNEQVRQNLEACAAGALPRDVVDAMESMWDSIKDVKVAYEVE